MPHAYHNFDEISCILGLKLCGIHNVTAKSSHSRYPVFSYTKGPVLMFNIPCKNLSLVIRIYCYEKNLGLTCNNTIKVREDERK